MTKVFIVKLELVNDLDHDYQFETFLFSNREDAKKKFDELVEEYSYLALDGFYGDSQYSDEDEMKEDCLGDDHFGYYEMYSSIRIVIEETEVK